MLLPGAFLLLPGTAEAQTYDLTPGVDYILWDDGLGIEDSYLYGGRFGLTFGDFVSLQPFYFTRSNVEANPADIEDGEAFEGLPEREMDMRHVGASLQIEFARGGNVVPFIRAGGGVLRLEPDGGERSDQITLEGGAGLRFGFGGLAAEIYAKDLAFSVNRYRLYSDPDEGTGFPIDEEGDDLRHNLALGAGIRLGLGGQSGADLGRRGGAAIPIEPFVGRLDYSDDLPFDDQNLAGVRAGLDFNELFGIRGYFWRGVNDDFDDTDPVDSYGGEAQFNLNRGGGLSPYLIVGAGRLDFDEDDEAAGGIVAPEDRTALILGGGLRFGLGERAGINVAVRDYIFDASEEFEDVRSTDNLLHNPLFSAGLAFRVGGDRDRRDGRTAVADDAELERLREETVRLQREIEEVRRANDRLREQEPEVARPARVDTVVRYEERDREGRVIREEVREPREREDAGRTVTIPIPPRGEVYFRYGEEAAATGEHAAAADEQSVVPRTDPAELREAIRLAIEEERARLEEDGGPISEEDILRLEQRLGERIERSIAGEGAPRELLVVPTPADDGMDEAVFERRFAELERRLNNRIDLAVEREVERRVDQQLEERLGQRLQADIDSRVDAEVERQLRLRDPAAEDDGTGEPSGVVSPDTTAPDRDREGMPLSLDSLMDYWELREVQPYAGANVDHPTQFVAGAQFDLGPATPGSPFDFIPEVAVGFGEDNPTVMLTANLRYMIGTFGQDWAISPFLMAGGGIFSPTLLAVNLGYGAALDLGISRGAPVRAFIQHQGINFFSRNRVLIGFEVDRWGR